MSSSSVPAEALLSYLIQEFGDNRSIASVVPLEIPAAVLESADLLALSPEQAEETQLCVPSTAPVLLKNPLPSFAVI